MSRGEIERQVWDGAVERWAETLSDFSNTALASGMQAMVTEMTARTSADATAAFLTQIIRQHMEGRNA